MQLVRLNLRCSLVEMSAKQVDIGARIQAGRPAGGFGGQYCRQVGIEVKRKDFRRKEAISERMCGVRRGEGHGEQQEEPQ